MEGTTGYQVCQVRLPDIAVRCFDPSLWIEIFMW